ncbi:MAG TPA: aspartate kinase, partial [Clostridia bacterium]|nr:aspartate kinase [Clostridia bacterium]
GDTTDHLLELAATVSSNPRGRELDALLSTGEQTSSSLLALALHDIGVDAISFTGIQAGILTDGTPSKARIERIQRDHILRELEKGRVVVITGYQGVDCEGNITTLGRGGSDTTAVALAAVLRADACEIFTDVDAVYTADPRIVPQAKRLAEISYDEMSEMATLGAKVLQPRSVELAKRYQVPLRVRSSFTQSEGTLVRDIAEAQDRGGRSMLEQVMVRGVAHSADEVKLVVEGVPDVPGMAARLFGELAENKIAIDMIIQSMHKGGTNDIAFTVPREDFPQAMAVSKRIAQEIGAKGVVFDENVAKVSLVGTGITQDSRIPAKMFKTLAQQGINIDMISTSGTRISCVIDKDRVEDAVRALHEAFFSPGESPEELPEATVGGAHYHGAC